MKHKSLLINGFLCGTRDDDTMVRASSLSCLGELCKVLGFRLGHALTEVNSQNFIISHSMNEKKLLFAFLTDPLLHIMHYKD